MNIDFHCHAQVFKKQIFKRRNIRRLSRYAEFVNIDAIVLAEHFDSRYFHRIYKHLINRYDYIDGYFKVNNLKIFPGMEVDIKEIGHVIVAGDINDVLSMRSLFPKKITKNDYPTLKFLTSEAKKRDMLIIGSHPYRKDKPLHHLSKEQINLLDYLDFNGKDIKHAKKMKQFASLNNINMVAGSDTHQFLTLGTVTTQLYNNPTNIKDIKKELEANRYRIIPARTATFRNFLGNNVKKHIKTKELKLIKQMHL